MEGNFDESVAKNIISALNDVDESVQKEHMTLP